MTNTKFIVTALIFTILSIPLVHGEERMTPEEITLSFIKEFKEWNDHAMELSESNHEKARWNIEKEYDDIILKYCRETLKYQPLAYGSEARHNPEKEKILNIKYHGDTAIVYTKHERKVASVDLSNFYEYSFEKEGDRWYLVSIAVVINGERHEGL